MSRTHVRQHDERADAHVHPVAPAEDAEDRVLPEDDEEDDRDVHRVAMQVLEEEELRLAVVPMRGALADRARGGIPREGAVVGLAVVVASEPEARGTRQDEHRGREKPEPHLVRPAHFEERRVERREVRAPLVRVALEGAPRRVDDEAREDEDGRRGTGPPVVLAEGAAERLEGCDGQMYGLVRHDLLGGPDAIPFARLPARRLVDDAFRHLQPSFGLISRDFCGLCPRASPQPVLACPRTGRVKTA